jgi:hypothetical protein
MEWKDVGRVTILFKPSSWQKQSISPHGRSLTFSLILLKEAVAIEAKDKVK